MASAGIDISITGDSSGFTDATQEAAKAAETAAREIADTTKRQAETDRRRYDESMSDLRRSTQARIAAEKDVQRAQAAAARAAAEANSRNTAESRAAAQAKMAEAAAARKAAEAAVAHQRAAVDTAQKSRNAMRDSASEASRAADAHLRAGQALARAQAAGRRVPGGALSGGRGAGGAGGGGGVGGAVGRIVAGAMGGAHAAGGGGGGGSQALGSAGEATEVIEGIISGGAVEIVKNGDKIVNLLKTYGTTVAKGTAVATAVIGTGVAIGYAIGDWEGFKASAKKLTDKVDEFGKALGNPAQAAEAVATWITAYVSGAKALEAQAEKMDKDFEKYQEKASQEMARRRGAATGSNAEALGKAQAQGINSRQEILTRTLAEREAAMELAKIKLDGIQSEEVKAQQLADLEKKWLAEKARLIKDHADYEYQKAAETHAEAKKALDDLKAESDKNRNAAGVGGGNDRWKEIQAALPGVESRYETSKSALESTGKAAADAASGQTTAGTQSKIIDLRQANAEADREAERARASSVRRLKEFWQAIEDTTKKGIENAQRVAAQAASKQDADQDLQELQLRARGSNRAADKIKKEREIQKSAKEYQAATGASPEQARAFAEQKYDAANSNGRIRGAGRKAGAEPPPAFGLDNPGFTPGRLGVQPSGPGTFGRLDALNEMQKKNRRIRGAGHKERDQAASDAAGAAAGAAGNAVIGGGVGAVVQAILGRLASMDRKLENLSPAKQIRKN